MDKGLHRTIGLIVLTTLLVGCSQALTREAPVPSKVMDMIREAGSITPPMTEFVPQMVIAETILTFRAQEDGTVGGVCDAIDLVQPNIEKQLAQRTSGEVTGDSSTTEALQKMLDQFSRIKEALTCESLAVSHP